MTDSPYTIRNYQPADFDNYVLLCQEAERLEPLGRPASPQDIAGRLARPDYSPGQDLFIVEISGEIIGCMDITPELSIRRVILDAWLHPKHRRKGLATSLLGHAMHRAKELGARAVHVNVMEDNNVARTALSRLDFQCVRRFLEFKLDMAKLRRQEMEQAARECRYLQRGEEEKLTLIQNRCFAGSWGYNVNIPAAIACRLSLGHGSPEDVVLTYQGDDVAGYCWTEVARSHDEPEGRIYMLGVAPEYRGKGISRRLLLAGLALLGSKGLQVSGLTVDSENEVACNLYRSAGFEARSSSLWYEKAVT